MDTQISDKLKEVLNIFEMPKFLVTIDHNGEPNSALITSWTHYKNNELVYGDFMTYKTRKNLDEGNAKIALLVMSTDLDSWLIKADFMGFHKNDDIYEFIAMTPLFRYNQYTNARAAGLAKVRSVSKNYKVSKVSVLSSFIKAKLIARNVPKQVTHEGNLPYNIQKRFGQMAAVKVVSYLDEDGYPAAYPALGMVPAGTNRLAIDRGEERRQGHSLSDGQRVAISLVTLEPAAFQVKGTFRIFNEKRAYIEIDRVYVCSLPKPGERVDIPILKQEV